MQIIVLDDNRDILEAVSLVLKKVSPYVVALTDPSQLEQKIPRHEPALLLMDIFLGGHDGRQICRQLKDSSLFDQLSIILFSAQTYTQESVDASGADAVLTKPFSLKTLYSVIEPLMKRKA